ncbi:MAG: hypothetical protein B5766_08635 [Candidatus Lumbricidophila eiseniae]|uniref:Uncharacterized protein n=1 Tax=Candidatus Lumbricidiphila eiseniae TaxID=1969409 RepID=A0A2A6FQJ9_9MICO|nr:MAG: hypothetical protein B5766_08635 [Candidatus Lumbricidophila eiseniae]
MQGAWWAQVVKQERVVVASREFSTNSGDLTLRILASTEDSPSFEYQFLDQNGEVTESLETYGADSLQALLFCITAAGDYLQRFVPTASFADLGVTALLTTDLSASGEWRAQVSIPAILST